ncbi:DEAD/DEAH box helicase [Candidatus Saccharibacteria bacterium]|nr:DEAD/DEAH box helicase [Candidatus Saccharibacteria bacterium]
MSYQSTNRRPSYGRARFSGSSSPKRGPKKENIHPSRFIKAARAVEIEDYVPTNSFADFDVNELLKTNLKISNILTPSPIQDQAIPAGLAGKDVVGIANTGTGKTLAFAIPMLHKLLTDKQSRALILAPTRELAQQIEEQCRVIGRGSGLTGAILIGGSSMGPQLRDLRAGARIVIGTPGRIKDHIERNTLNLSSFNTIVLDEFDRMLDMGFLPDVRFILEKLHRDRQSFFFSATLDARVRGLIQEFSHDPITISVKTSETVDSVEQNIVTFNSKSDKIEKLHELLISGQNSKMLVFDDTQRSVERLSDELLARGFHSDAIHGGKSQGQRQRALQKFKKNEITVLVATDVAARGIDVPDITHVINYSTPSSYDDYVHRIGRAGRAGRMGHALTFIEKY